MSRIRELRDRGAAWLGADFNIVRLLLFVVAVAGMVAVFDHMTPGPEIVGIDRMLYWSFIIFVVGLGELFVLLIMLALFNKIDLAQAFMDKEGLERAVTTATAAAVAANPAAGEGAVTKETSPYVQKMTSSVSLSRLQAFLWTIIIMILYFHEAVKQKLAGGEGLPDVSPDLFLLMGISSAVYLVARQKPAKEKAPGAAE